MRRNLEDGQQFVSLGIIFNAIKSDEPLNIDNTKLQLMRYLDDSRHNHDDELVINVLRTIISELPEEKRCGTWMFLLKETNQARRSNNRDIISYSREMDLKDNALESVDLLPKGQRFKAAFELLGHHYVDIKDEDAMNRDHNAIATKAERSINLLSVENRFRADLRLQGELPQNLPIIETIKERIPKDLVALPINKRLSGYLEVLVEGYGDIPKTILPDAEQFMQDHPCRGGGIAALIALKNFELTDENDDHRRVYRRKQLLELDEDIPMKLLSYAVRSLPKFTKAERGYAAYQAWAFADDLDVAKDDDMRADILKNLLSSIDELPKLKYNENLKLKDVLFDSDHGTHNIGLISRWDFGIESMAHYGDKYAALQFIFIVTQGIEKQAFRELREKAERVFVKDEMPRLEALAAERAIAEERAKHQVISAEGFLGEMALRNS